MPLDPTREVIAKTFDELLDSLANRPELDLPLLPLEPLKHVKLTTMRYRREIERLISELEGEGDAEST